MSPVVCGPLRFPPQVTWHFSHLAGVICPGNNVSKTTVAIFLHLLLLLLLIVVIIPEKKMFRK